MNIPTTSVHSDSQNSTALVENKLGDLNLYELTCGSSTVQIAKFGGQIIAGSIAGRNVFFDNPKLISDKSKAIRSGAPICFPWFNKGLNWKLGREITPSHGPVRSSDWELCAELITPDSVSIGFQTDTTSHLGLSLRINVDYRLNHGSLKIEFAIENLSTEKNAFELALHTYFATTCPDSVAISGLKDQAENPFIPNIPIDQIFENNGDKVTVRLPDYLLEIENQNFSKSVVWHPGLIHNLADVAQEPSPAPFLCVESLSNMEEIAGSSRWKSSVTYSVKS